MEKFNELRKVVREILNEIEKTASDGGYYNGTEKTIRATKEEVKYLERIKEELSEELFSGDGIVVIRNDEESSVKMEYIQQLLLSVDIEHDSESGESYFWITNKKDIPLAKIELKAIDLYDKVVG